jgi:hypothetical protein
LLPVRARAGARRSALAGIHDGALKISVTVPPEKGLANKAIHALLCKELGLPKSQLTLISGRTSHDKTFLVRDLSLDQLRRLMDQALRRL